MLLLLVSGASNEALQVLLKLQTTLLEALQLPTENLLKNIKHTHTHETTASHWRTLGATHKHLLARQSQPPAPKLTASVCSRIESTTNIESVGGDLRLESPGRDSRSQA